MLTLRSLSADGFGNKPQHTHTERSAALNVEREVWAQHQNGELERLGFASRVDLRSLEAQGVDREATVHKGPFASGMERKGMPSRIVDENRGIEDRNNTRNDDQRSAVVVSLDLERLKRDEARSIVERQTAIASAQLLSLIDLERRQYRQTLNLQVEFAGQYGLAKATMTAAAHTLQNRIETTGLKRLLREFKGRNRADRAELDGIRQTLGSIRQRESEAVGTT